MSDHPVTSYRSKDKNAVLLNDFNKFLDKKLEVYILKDITKGQLLKVTGTVEKRLDKIQMVVQQIEQLTDN